MGSDLVFPYRWNLSDGYPAPGIKKHGCTAFGTFICGGGSSMGYKLAGYEHLGGVEIDPVVANVYRTNHHPKHLFVEDIRTFLARDEYPEELYNLDLLDGSPPCSTFSTNGQREKAWGKEKCFTEGQKKQTLDDLVFIYCDLILKLKPKTFLLENVSGLAKGNGKAYLARIAAKMSKEYEVQTFLLNAATMGVPQARERVFVIGHRKEFILPKLELKFTGRPIVFGEIIDTEDRAGNISPSLKFAWDHRRPGDKDLSDINKRLKGKASGFSTILAISSRVLNTHTAGTRALLYDYPRTLNDKEVKLCSSFPLDYNSLNKDIGWLAGMSVPPVMTANIAHEIYRQWLSKIK